MREIKFRQYQDGVWVEPRIEGHMNINEYINDKDRTICQSTGLHDKNYTEIYEGDILRHTYEKFNDERGAWDEHQKNYVVEWHSSMANCGYRCRNGRNIFPIKQGTIFNGRAEIIGNIYENPELLEVTP